MVIGEQEERMVEMTWGTWEELVLGGSVLRHGTRDWAIVSSELQIRTLYPDTFTPEACKAKYEDLQRRYFGSKAWFEELRKQRVAELRRELEISEGSIGSLESKLENLKAEKDEFNNNNNNNQVDYCSSQTESPLLVLVKSEGIESSGKETSKDGLSAGSFTHDTRRGGQWSPVEKELERKTKTPQVELEPKKQEMVVVEIGNKQMGTIRKRRGKRKRKDCNLKEKNENSGSPNVVVATTTTTASLCEGNSATDYGQSSFKLSRANDDLMSIFNSVAVNHNALVFRHRLDSQKRARYKKIIRRHMDFDTIRSRITNCSIKSAKELFRDMLLLANNALVFYSKRTREYKSALSLRDVVAKEYRHQCEVSANKPTYAVLSTSMSIRMCNPPVRPRSFRPFKHRLPAKVVATIANDDGNISVGTPKLCEKQGNNNNNVGSSSLSVDSSILPKKGLSRAGKAGGRNQRTKTPLKEKKKVQQRR